MCRGLLECWQGTAPAECQNAFQLISRYIELLNMHLVGWYLIVVITALLLVSPATASIGDRLPEFKQCLAVSFRRKGTGCKILNTYPDMPGSQLWS